MPELSSEDGPAHARLCRSIFGGDFSRYTLSHALEWNDRPAVDLPDARRWVFDEAVLLGFDGELANHYDANMLHTYGDGRARPGWAERIGKKYQWIALYRLAGIVADHVPAIGRNEPAADETAAPPRLQAAASAISIRRHLCVRATSIPSAAEGRPGGVLRLRTSAAPSALMTAPGSSLPVRRQQATHRAHTPERQALAADTGDHV
jgi:hypothetical protein